jgi:hypothetical protein
LRSAEARGAAAGADLDRLDHRHLERQAAALGDAAHPRHLELVGALGRVVAQGYRM